MTELTPYKVKEPESTIVRDPDRIIKFKGLQRKIRKTQEGSFSDRLKEKFKKQRLLKNANSDTTKEA